MEEIDWLDVLGWSDDQLHELRMTGYSMLQQGHYQKAAIYFEGLCFLNPENLYDLQTLGALYLQMDLDEKALATLDQALRLDPLDEATQLNRAKALIMLGKKTEALRVAKQLTMSKNVSLAGDATALIMGYM